MKYRVITYFEDQKLGQKTFDSLEDAEKYAEEKHKFNPEWISEVKKVGDGTR